MKNVSSMVLESVHTITLLAIGPLLLGACSTSGSTSSAEATVDVPAETTASVTTVPGVAATYPAAPTSAGAAVSSTTVPPEDPFPPADDVTAQLTLTALEESGLIGWLETIDGTLEQRTCDPETVMLGTEQFEAVMSLPDEVAGNLFANLDAAMGAAGEWCRRGDEDAADTELADAARTFDLLTRRLVGFSE